jgi:hypothetical protein
MTKLHREYVLSRQSAAENLDIRNIINNELDELDEYSRTPNAADPRETVTPKNRMTAKTKARKNKG